MMAIVIGITDISTSSTEFHGHCSFIQNQACEGDPNTEAMVLALKDLIVFMS